MSGTPLIDVNDPNYTPGKLLDAISRKLQVRSDQQLAYRVGLGSDVISRIRHKKRGISALHVLYFLDTVPDLTLQELRELSGIPKYRSAP